MDSDGGSVKFPVKNLGYYNIVRDLKIWGNRVRVRIMGYHPQSTTELPDEDLPWAQVLLSPQCGSGKAGVAKPIKNSTR